MSPGFLFKMMTSCLYILAMALLLSSVDCRTLTFENRLPFTAWVGSQGDKAFGERPVHGGGWEMAASSVMHVEVEDGWRGVFWARTGCDFDDEGKGHCQTGDCGNKLKCAGANGQDPVTEVGIALDVGDGFDGYHVNILYGFNVPASIAPAEVEEGEDRLWCSAASCNTDFNPLCPQDLRVEVEGEVVACKSACLDFMDEDDNDPIECEEVPFTQELKKGCPHAYAFPMDPTGLFTCRSTSNYTIVWGV